MNRKFLNQLAVPIVGFLLMAASSHANADFTIKRIVNCDQGMDVQRVLDRNLFSLPMELKLVGTCDGFAIGKDDVSISPLHDHSCPGATVEGWISMEGAHGIELRCFQVMGPDSGVSVFGSHALLEDMHISGGGGIEVGAGGRIEVVGGSITGNEEGVVLEAGYAVLEDVEFSHNGGNAIRAENNSYVEFGGGIVMNNGEYGIDIASSSVLSMEYTNVSNNGRNGIFVRGSSRADIIDAVITGHTKSGLVIQNNSSVRWNGGRIAENGWNGISVTSHSTLRVLPGEEAGQATEIVDNDKSGIFLIRDAGVQIFGAYIPPNGNGYAIRCIGKESSVDYSDSPMIDPAYVDCIDPDF